MVTSGGSKSGVVSVQKANYHQFGELARLFQADIVTIVE